MDIKDLLKNANNLPSYQLERRLNKLVRENYRYRNLSAKNKKLLLEYIKKYISKIKRGYSVTSETIRRDMLKFYQNREKLDLTYEDLKDFREVLNMFRK
jgi:hypothetical protein